MLQEVSCARNLLTLLRLGCRANAHPSRRVNSELFLQCQHRALVNVTSLRNTVDSESLLIVIADSHSTSNVVKVWRQRLAHHHGIRAAIHFQIGLSFRASLLFIERGHLDSIIALAKLCMRGRRPERTDWRLHVLLALLGVHVQRLYFLQVYALLESFLSRFVDGSSDAVECRFTEL